MPSYLRKYVTALASAKSYVAQWSTQHVYADEALIVPFPTLAIFDREKQTWSINIKAWLYLPFEGKKIKGYLSSLPNILSSKTEDKIDDSMNKDNKKNDVGKSFKVLLENEDNKDINKQDELTDDDDGNDDVYENALENDFGKPNENPGRLGLFFVGRSVEVITKSIINDVEHLLHPSDESGFVEQQIELSDNEIQSLAKKLHPESNDRKFEYEIRIDESTKDSIRSENYKTFKCPIYVLATYGISIISDIDDTIKISKVLSKRSLLKHTFYGDFKPVEGMNELYQKWYEQNCQFHYVSGSPWQLYPALSCFLERHKYPMGTMNLRKFEWSLKFLSLPESYKREIITGIIQAYPFRIYICVGDSGELDPEIYSQLCKEFPENIAHIFIRDTCRTPECLPTCQERYIKAFKDIPKHRWTVFKDPKEIETNLDNIINA
ncbi:unnamed protein product [Rotaria sp. Silwood1]|nr:unnamed protein product [Rotaria sp. Silwood1]CAF0960015.1 unnamed protein product [Rotaria sp. Silwood1]CAF3375131.1 unnamed protein product [Rotaria sp. Silwood1]CAF4557449.1 unnamed protein product [Rotaria sp. Silwood1]CAF4786952.1 unnamed protein product [Rotaria sp. Silwood1]